MAAWVLLMASSAVANDDSHMAAEHGGGVFHKFQLEVEMAHKSTKSDLIQRWDFDGWIGTDENKLWLKAEGDRVHTTVESAEFELLYSRNVATFWDAQAGIRYDSEPESTAYAVLGMEGLAPYFFETEAYVFVSEHGNTTARLKQETDLLLTQRWIAEPYVEANFAAQEVPEQEIGAGVTDGKIGVQTRYEFTRQFAPYIDLAYQRKFGETAAIARRDGEEPGAFVSAVGIKLTF